MIDLNLLRIFCKVAELGSFTKAAKQLNQPKSRISRAVTRLEEDLKVHLIRRTTRQMTLTDTGQALFKKSYYLLDSLQNELQEIAQDRTAISGLLRIAAPEDFGQGVLGHVIPRFLELYPDMQFELMFSNEYQDLVAQQIDVAFRIGALKDANLIKRKLGSTRVILVASPEYLTTYGRPLQIDELHKHKLLSFQLENDPECIFAEYFPAQGFVPCIKSNHFSVLLQMALQHRGIASLPEFFVYQDLKAGNLERVLDSWSTETYPIHLLYPPTRQMPLKTRCFIDFIVKESKVYLAGT